ncbi:MAG: hypothetical protein ACYCZY_00960 [Lacisediminihabitans sp.]
MSTNLAYALPARAPRLPVEVPGERRHIEIVSTRSQRRARPRLVYALVTVAGLFIILVAQLLLSILLSDGAYQISALQSAQTELSRDQQTLTEQLDVLKSPQNLSARAQALGMVMSDAPAVYLRLSDSAVIGTPTPANAAQGSTIGANGALSPNSLLSAQASQPAQPSASAGASATTSMPGSVASNPGALPSPITH